MDLGTCSLSGVIMELSSKKLQPASTCLVCTYYILLSTVRNGCMLLLIFKSRAPPLSLAWIPANSSWPGIVLLYYCYCMHLVIVRPIFEKAKTMVKLGSN